MIDDLDQTGEHMIGIDQTLLPPMAKRLIAIMGERMAVRLMKRRGGTQIKIPAGLRPAATMRDSMGLSAAAIRALASSDLANEMIEVPKVDAIVKHHRNEAIRADREKGFTVSELALKYNLTRLWIRQILNEKENSKNLELF